MNKAELASILVSDTKWRQWTQTPIVDIHTHTFNAKYLPIRKIALARRDASAILGFVPDSLAEAAASKIIRHTKLTEPVESAALAAPISGEMAAASRDPRLEAFSETLESLDAGSTMRVQAAPRDPAFDAAALGAPSAEDQQSVIDVAQRVFPETRQLTKKKSLKDSYLIIRHFLSCIIHEDGDMVPWYRRDYGENDVRLMVSHMMDLGPVYDQPADGVSLLDFESEQVRRMAKRQATTDSGLIYFVAYSPYREHWPQGDSGPGHALAIVENAVLQHGAYGIKLYPPSGYRPCHNEIPEKPRTWFTKEPGIQWSARYTDGSGKKLTGAEFDRRLLKLFEWCAKDDIPIFAHCSTGEMQARAGYGKAMAHPQWWVKLLQENPQLYRLRLCLGHAGGSAYWFGEESDRDWGECVRELCATYPNVYCEVGIHDGIVDGNKQVQFANLMADLLNRPPTAEEPYSFSKKIMYGTDWFMPLQVVRKKDYLESFQRVFLHDALRPHYRRFFLGNAIEFLNVRSRLQDESHPLPASVKKRLGELLSRWRFLSSAS